MNSHVAAEPIRELSRAGVSIWLDDLSRERLITGNLKDLIASRGVVGVTTNPTIFAAALSKGHAYDTQLRDLAAAHVDTAAAVEAITTDDVRQAADILRPVYEATDGVDGRVSIEVDPRMARDTEATIATAQRLWTEIDRPNLLVKIPATAEGIPAITATLARGISVNVTLIFSLDRYRSVVEAFFSGMEQATKAGLDLAPIASVASFFVSRVDTAVDAVLEDASGPEAATFRGKAAIANARLAFGEYERLFATDRWLALADLGGHPQRPLWASTGVKDPAFADTLYVSELVTAGVVNTMPEKTLNAFADHGKVEGDTVRGRESEARDVLSAIAKYGVDLDEITERLEVEGVEKFVASWAELTESVREGLQQAGSKR